MVETMVSVLDVVSIRLKNSPIQGRRKMMPPRSNRQLAVPIPARVAEAQLGPYRPTPNLAEPLSRDSLHLPNRAMVPPPVGTSARILSPIPVRDGQHLCRRRARHHVVPTTKVLVMARFLCPHLKVGPQAEPLRDVPRSLLLRVALIPTNKLISVAEPLRVPGLVSRRRRVRDLFPGQDLFLVPEQRQVRSMAGPPPLPLTMVAVTRTKVVARSTDLVGMVETK